LCDLSDAAPDMMFPAERPLGVMYNQSQIRISSITDGTSQTACFSEKLCGQGTPDPRTDMFMMMPMTLSVDQTSQTCQGLDMSYAGLSQQGASWSMGEIFSTTYNHVSGPNSRTCTGMDGSMMMSMAGWAMQIPASSNHPGGANVLMGDGAVHFVKNSIDLRVWRALATRNGGEVISGDSL